MVGGQEARTNRGKSRAREKNFVPGNEISRRSHDETTKMTVTKNSHGRLMGVSRASRGHLVFAGAACGRRRRVATPRPEMWQLLDHATPVRCQRATHKLAIGRQYEIFRALGQYVPARIL